MAFWNRQRSKSVRPTGNLPDVNMDVLRAEIARRRNAAPSNEVEPEYSTKRRKVPPWIPGGWVPTKEHQENWANWKPIISPITGRTLTPPDYIENQVAALVVEESPETIVRHEEEVPLSLSSELSFAKGSELPTVSDEWESKESSNVASDRGKVNLDPKNPKMNTIDNRLPTSKKTLSVAIKTFFGSWVVFIIGFHLGALEFFPYSTLVTSIFFLSLGVAVISMGQSPLATNKGWYMKVGVPLVAIGIINLTLSISLYTPWLRKLMLFIEPSFE